MPNFPSLGHSAEHDAFLAIIDPTTITHPLPVTGQNPWDETFRLWAGDVESSIYTLDDDVAGLDTRVAELEAAPPGGGGIGEVRSDTTGGFNYMGSAPTGTIESAAGWSLTRIQLVSPPVVGHATGAWTDRTTLTYT